MPSPPFSGFDSKSHPIPSHETFQQASQDPTLPDTESTAEARPSQLSQSGGAMQACMHLRSTVAPTHHNMESWNCWLVG
ncbi:hypothetical protein DL95DRAFT_384664 [Leptodontidium sp. 2 PMI_412]|nr:hypothetical protein DL95DRAFT_384664 [Leptodontidium sp. 2 PMI_412]